MQLHPLLALVALPLVPAAALVPMHSWRMLSPTSRAAARSAPDFVITMLAKTKRKSAAKKGGARANKISSKGFGARTVRGGGQLLDEPKYAALYAWLAASPLTVLHKVAVADFGGLRGVMALQDIGAGEEIVAIPATMAVDVGADGADAVDAAQRLLAVRALETEPAYEPDDDEDDDDLQVPPASPRASYWATLPPPDSPDLCTPDFFSDDQLEMLQWPPLIAETRERSARARCCD